MATLDPPLDVLRDQILDCTTLERAEIGWIAGAGHVQSGGHYPENPPPPGNPPSEVDAIDVPHKPSAGADMHVLTEALRLSRDSRIKFVIFNRRIFSSYDHAEGDPFTWRPYRESDPHTGHAHIERTDQRRTDLRPWSIGIDGKAPIMFLAACKVGDKTAPHVQFLMLGLFDLYAVKYPGATLYPVKDGVPQLPATFDAKTGVAMKDLLDGGNGVDFTPTLAKRLVRKLGSLDAIAKADEIEPGEAVTAEQARDIARREISNATATLTPSAG